MNTVRVYGTKAEFRALCPMLARFFRRALQELEVTNAFVEVILVDNKEIRALNKKYRRKDKATNILSFPVDRAFRKVAVESRIREPLGEIYLAPKYIARHKENLRFMAAHGLLHLLGHDHKKNRARTRMERLEQKLMASRP